MVRETCPWERGHELHTNQVKGLCRTLLCWHFSRAWLGATADLKASGAKLLKTGLLCFSSRVGLGALQRSLPTPTILTFFLILWLRVKRACGQKSRSFCWDGPSSGWEMQESCSRPQYQEEMGSFLLRGHLLLAQSVPRGPGSRRGWCQVLFPLGAVCSGNKLNQRKLVKGRGQNRTWVVTNEIFPLVYQLKKGY